MLQTQNQPEYITATIKDWNHLLKEDEFTPLLVISGQQFLDKIKNEHAIFTYTK